MLRLLLIVVAVTACDGGRDPCAKAVDHLWQRKLSAHLWRREVPAWTRGVVEATKASCRETRWPADVLDCLQEAGSNEEHRSCLERLTGEQRVAMDRVTATITLAALRDLRDQHGHGRVGDRRRNPGEG